MANPNSGHGATITFSSGFFGTITNISHSGISRRALKTSHSGTNGGETYIPADLIESGELQVDLLFDEDDEPPIDAAAETCTVTFPGTGTVAGSAFLTNFRFTIPAAQEEGIMTASATLKYSGDLTWT